MLFKTKRFEIEISHYDLYLRVTAFGRTFATFRDWSGQGLGATDWYQAVQTGNATMEVPYA